MAIPKVMGIETEYGITVKNQPDFNPILSSLLLINSYETYRSSRIRWDYEAESPLRDARGFEYMEDKEVPSKEESRLINLILSNGARFYVDHAHPEYSSPETTNPRDCVIWDRAGERILNLSRTRAEAVSPPEQRILIYKNNTDSKGNSYGTHENYLMDRKVPFARIVQYLLPFFVSRQVFTGAGKVGAENNTEFCEFQISQRADFLETEVGLETMHSRPIINTRDEPHADPEKYRRLHVIVGRRQHERGLQLPQVRHDGHRAEHDRGRLHRARPLARQPGALLPHASRATSAAARPSGSRTAAP